MRRIALILFSVLILGAALLFGRAAYKDISSRLPELEKTAAEFVAEQVKKQISTPPPLRARVEAPDAFLTETGVLKWTNFHRDKIGLPPLIINPNLNSVADLRLEDMFAKQYFAHYSPTGVGAPQTADRVGYDYLAIGENIALGNFKDDQALVQAWMDSPGHRANILSTKYIEIGIAVGRGNFESRTTWLGVQIFALSLSACPQPEVSLKGRIEALRSEAEQLEMQLAAMREEFDQMKPRSREEREAYNQKVDEYNALVAQYNGKVAELKGLIAQYNSQVEAFNSCAGAVQ